MNNVKNIKWIIRIGVLFIVLIIILAKPIYTMLTSQEHWSRTELTDYKELFKNNEHSKLILFNTIQSKVREPESQYIYDENFNIFVTKLHAKEALDLIKDITTNKQYLSKEYNDLYLSIRSSGSKIHLKSGKLPLVNDIQIGVEDSDVKRVDSNVNRVSFYILFKKLSLTINQNQNYIIAESEKPYHPITFSFIKKDNSLYIIMMTQANNNTKMQPDQLTNLLN
jgi:hypothetical protein